jgi:hypothetical protein
VVTVAGIQQQLAVMVAVVRMHLVVGTVTNTKLVAVAVKVQEVHVAVVEMGLLV